MIKASKFGLLPPRYTFAINPYQEARFTICPNCRKPNFLRKFPLMIHIEDWGLMPLGKTCRYCAKCEYIIVHKDELEGELALFFSKVNPEFVGKKYLVFGTMEKKAWKVGLDKPTSIEESRASMADFKKVMTLHYQPAGWYFDDKPKGRKGR